MKYLLILLAALFLPQTGVGHPHIWTYTSLTLLVENAQIMGVRVGWEFDALYSTSFLAEADTNQNKKLDEDETAHTIKMLFIEGQKDLHPFMHIAPLSEKQSFALKNPLVWMEGEYLKYQFDIILDAPSPLKGRHEFGIYDPEFYVAFEQDLEMILPEGVSCTQTLAENKHILIYFDLVNPETYALECS